MLLIEIRDEEWIKKKVEICKQIHFCCHAIIIQFVIHTKRKQNKREPRVVGKHEFEEDIHLATWSSLFWFLISFLTAGKMKNPEDLAMRTILQLWRDQGCTFVREEVGYLKTEKAMSSNNNNGD